MSRLGFLSAPQLAKHYDVVRFLAQHPNESFSLRELDERLPRGASLLRFPEDWVSYMEDGECDNKNIEVSRRAVKRRRRTEGEPDPDNVIFFCRRPHIQSLEELRSLLEPPSAQPDGEACIGVHTDQMIISPSLISAAQEAGWALFIPDAAPPSSGDKSAAGDGADFSRATADLTSGGVPMTFLLLPPGVSLRSRLRTRRGIVVEDQHGVPSQWWVGEQLQLAFHNRLAVEQHGEGALTVMCHWSGLTGEEESTSPARIRRRAAETDVPGVGKVSTIRLDILPLSPGTRKLVLTICGEEMILEVSIKAHPCALPGVLLAVETQPLLEPPSHVLLQDPLVNGLHRRTSDCRLPLPWFLSPSPLVPLVRESTFPSAAACQAATAHVFSSEALQHEARVRLARFRHQERTELAQLEADGAARRVRHRRTAVLGGRGFMPDVCNTHMIFFGLDLRRPYEA